MHLRRTSWIALPLIVSLSLGGLVPSAWAKSDSTRVPRWRSSLPVPGRQHGGILTVVAATLAGAALLGGVVGKYLPLADKAEKATLCRAAYPEDKGAIMGTWRRGPVLYTLPALGLVVSQGTETAVGVTIGPASVTAAWREADRSRWFEISKVNDLKFVDGCADRHRSHAADLVLWAGASEQGAKLAPK